MGTLQTQGKEQSSEEQGQAKELLQVEGVEVIRHIVPGEREGWREGVNRQCRSRKRTKYIYINSLLYNHEQKKKKKHSHKNINLK